MMACLLACLYSWALPVQAQGSVLDAAGNKSLFLATHIAHVSIKTIAQTIYPRI